MQDVRMFEGNEENAVRRFRGLFYMLMVAFCVCGVGVIPQEASAVEVTSIEGLNRYETAARQAEIAFPNGCSYAIVVGGEAWPDALAAAGLAGVIDCPMLFTNKNELSAETIAAIHTLGVSKLIVIGGEGSVSLYTEKQLRDLPIISSITRLAGNDRYETQMAIYEFGRSGFDGTNRWGNELVMVASGDNFPDALSGSPLSFTKGAPIFLVDDSRMYSDAQMDALMEAGFKQAIILGGESAVSGEALGYVEAITALASDASIPNAIRLGGANRYETSELVASWCVSEGYLSWDGAAFASGSVPFDALAGGVLQGKRGAVMLLADNANSSTIGAFASKTSQIVRYCFLGGTGAISSNLRTYIGYSLQFGYALRMGPTRLPDRSYIWCNSSGVYREDNKYYGEWIDRANGYASRTGWLIMVDTRKNEVAIFSGLRGAWAVEKVWTCTTGAWNTPTVKGQFTIGMRGLSFGSGYTCWYWTQFYGNYLFHSVLYRSGSMNNIQDGRLGINASHGCVRLSLENAKWIYENIPTNTKVVVS